MLFDDGLPPGVNEGQRNEMANLPRVAGGDGGMMSKEFLSVIEIAAVLKVSTLTVYKWLNTGKLAHIRDGNSR